MPIIKQPRIYIDFASPDWVESYDHTLIKCPCDCKCNNLCEKGVGLCDICINNMVSEMTNDLDEVCENLEYGSDSFSTPALEWPWRSYLPAYLTSFLF